MHHQALKSVTKFLRVLALLTLISGNATSEDIGDQPPVKITATVVSFKTNS